MHLQGKGGNQGVIQLMCNHKGIIDLLLCNLFCIVIFS